MCVGEVSGRGVFVMNGVNYCYIADCSPLSPFFLLSSLFSSCAPLFTSFSSLHSTLCFSSPSFCVYVSSVLFSSCLFSSLLFIPSSLLLLTSPLLPPLFSSPLFSSPLSSSPLLSSPPLPSSLTPLI